MASASTTSRAVIADFVDQPTMRRECRSGTTATNSHPRLVQTWAKSAGHPTQLKERFGVDTL